MNPVMSIIGGILSKGKYVLGGGLGLFGASQLVTKIQDTASAAAEKVIEVHSGAQAQNGNIDSFFAGFNRTQGIMGFVAGIAMWIGQLTGNQGMVNWAEKQMKNSRDAQEAIQADIRERSKDAVQGLSGSVVGLAAGGTGLALGVGAASAGGLVASKLLGGNGPSGPTGGGNGPTGGLSSGVKAAQQADLDNPSKLNKALSETMDGDGNTIKRAAVEAVEEGVEAAAKKPGLMSRMLGAVTGRYGRIAAAAATVATVVPSVLSAEEAPAEAPAASGQTPTVREVEAQMLAERSLSEKISGAVRATGEGLNHGANSAVSTVLGAPHWLGEKMGINMPEVINGNNISSYFNELTDRVAPVAMIQNAVDGYKRGGFSGAFENVVDPAIVAKSEAEKKIYAGAEIAGQLIAGSVVAGPVGSFGAAALGGGRVAATVAPVAAEMIVPTVVMH